MSCKYSLVFLFLCGFAALTVSTQPCGKNLLEGTSCTIKLKIKNAEKPTEIKWVHLSSGALILRKRGKIKENTLSGKMEEDGSLTFESVSLKNTGKYKYVAFNNDGIQIANGEEEINVYAKAPKPTVTFDRDTDGNAVLTCDTGERTDLTVSWYKEGKIIQNEKKTKLLLTSAQVQENKPYSCSVNNPVSNEQSNSITVSFSTKACGKELLEGTSCTIELPTINKDKSNDIMWIHHSSGDFILRNNGRIRKNTPGLTMEEDGSLTFYSVSLKNTGKYRYTVFNAEGTQIDTGEKEIKVYAKAPKPTLTFIRDADGNAVLTCDIGERTDLTISWYEEDKIIQNEKKKKLLLTSAQVQENKPYSCSVSNPASNEQSDSMTVLFSTKTCGKELLEGTSCTIKLPKRNNEKPNEIKWIHLSSGVLIHWKNGKIKTNALGLTMEEDGSLTFENVSVKDTGKYEYHAYNNEGTEIVTGEEEINVYAKAPKPTVTFAEIMVPLSCDIGERTDLTVSWYKEGKIIQNEKKPKLLLTSAQVQENKLYSCSVSNPVSNEQSDSFTVSYDTFRRSSG